MQSEYFDQSAEHMVFNTSCTLIHLTKQGIGILLEDEDDLERVNQMQDSTALTHIRVLIQVVICQANL